MGGVGPCDRALTERRFAIATAVCNNRSFWQRGQLAFSVNELTFVEVAAEGDQREARVKFLRIK